MTGVSCSMYIFSDKTYIEEVEEVSSLFYTLLVLTVKNTMQYITAGIFCSSSGIKPLFTYINQPFTVV
jgi:hypothetical protein